MKLTTATTTLLAAFVSAVVASSSSPAVAGQQLEQRAAAALAPARSRHAARQNRSLDNTKLKKRGSRKCKAKSPVSASGSSTSSSSSDSSSSSSSSGGLSGYDMAGDYLKVNNIYIGMLPDDGSGGGKAESLSSLNAILPKKSFAYGRYAQVSNGKTFDGSQLYQVLDDVKANGAILHASVMPYGTWYGLTEADNKNAIAIAKVCKDIQDNHGVEVWLRFAHEMNWYQVDGTYSGGVEDFQQGWKVVAAAVKEISPQTKMWWSPNVGSMEDYKRYYPREGQVDLVGYDFYPDSADTNFLDRAKPFHDEFAKGDIKMVQGETGLHYSGSTDEKMKWLKSMTSPEVQSALPNYIGTTWFNYDKFETGKRIDFKLLEPSQDKSSGINSIARSYFSA